MAHNPFESLEQRLTRIEGLLLDLSQQEAGSSQAGDSNPYLNIDQLREYLPDRPAKSTIYRWVGAKSIPHIKRGKSLYFHKPGIDEWVLSGKKLTQSEIQKDAIDRMSQFNIGKRRA